MLSTMFRLTASSASSVGVQCVTGRPDASGGSQEMATISQICSAVKVAGVPLRGSSESTSSISRRNSLSVILPSATASRSADSAHRLRQRRGVWTCTPKSSAISWLRKSSLAISTILLRKTIHCGLWARRTICSSIVRWRSVNRICFGFGPLGLRNLLLSPSDSGYRSRSYRREAPMINQCRVFAKLV